MAKFKSDTERILEAVSNHGSTFSAFCSEYVDTPERGDREGWHGLFDQLEAMVSMELLTVERNDNNRIESLTLTNHGVAKLKELRERAF